MDLGLAGRVALVTGGSRGIGRATAHVFAREGMRIAIAARGAERLAATAAELTALGAEVLAIQADFGRPSEAARAVDETAARFGGLDVLVANAGGSVGERDLALSTDEDFDATFRFNVGHAIAATRAAVPHLEASGQGSAIFVASISGRAPSTRGAQYAAAKAGLIMAAKNLSWELGPQRIRVNAVSPGSLLFPGGGWERIRAERPEDFAKFEREDFPWGRLGTDTELADVIAFVASPRAGWVNGTDIQVDGGQRRPSIR
ncbi:SDR family NAD(P)-dependent oxidoreductase [Prosthecomicrobium sp. N25]|uniref:SDR family NAD(P)-dependent oxidoreductase n=1 Tax=Prosthecomicrobium sp. N25 TaxID=3129254 RepID=UPI0030770910